MAIGIEIIDCRWIQSSVKENRLVSLDPFVVAPPLILEQGFPLKGVANYNEEELVEQDSVAKSISPFIRSELLRRILRLSLQL